MTESVGRSAWHGIEVRHLAALQALAEEASFHGAARRLGYSQPAVSQQLAALERIVGVQLVNRPRVSQPLTLTEAGKRLLIHARAVQSSLATAEAEVCTGKARLRIGTYQTVSSLLLPHVIRELERREPQVDIVLDDRPVDGILVKALERNEIDACFVDLPLRFEGHLQTRPLAFDDYVLVLPRNGQRGIGTSVHPIELRGLNLIGFKSSGSTQRVIDHLRADGIEPHFVVRADDNNVVQGFVTAGFGAALIPRLTAELMSGSFDVRAFEPALPPRVIALAWKDDLTVAEPVRAFVDATTRVVRQIWRERAIETLHEVPPVASAHL
ncbi:MAG: LysR family transcriptional regulator [Gaiellaceae bacterium]|jgi:DNA-binding transcriptional LysR family regulator